EQRDSRDDHRRAEASLGGLPLTDSPLRMLHLVRCELDQPRADVEQRNYFRFGYRLNRGGRHCLALGSRWILNDCLSTDVDDTSQAARSVIVRARQHNT